MINWVLRVVPWSWRGHIKNIPGAARFQRFIVSATFGGREFVHLVDAGPARGVRFLVRLPEDKGIWTGGYERDFAAAVAAAVEPGSVAYDIGGWHGFFAGLMAARGANEVHVFEPLPENAERIRQMIKLNSHLRVHVHQCALGDADGETDLLVMPESSMAKLIDSAFQPDEHVDARIRVDMARLDTLAATENLAPPSIIKIDVEGAEVRVARGAMRIIRQYRPIIFAEIHSSGLLGEFTELLEHQGYTIVPLDRDLEAARRRGVYQIRAEPH
jgi:FkbM family methyltransferase